MSRVEIKYKIVSRMQHTRAVIIQNTYSNNNSNSNSNSNEMFDINCKTT